MVKQGGSGHVCGVVFCPAAGVAVGIADHHPSAGGAGHYDVVVVIVMSRAIQSEVCAAIRALLAWVPPSTAPVQQRADYQIRKAEVFDLIAATDACLAIQAGQLADRARQLAHTLTEGC